MLQISRGPALRLLLLVVLVSFNPAKSLKCRTEDGPSDAELKRITRSCMRKIGENARLGNGEGSSSNTGSSTSSHGASHSNRYGQQHQTRYGQQQANSDYDYNDDDDDNYNNNSNGNGNGNYNSGNYARSEDILRQRNRDRLPMNRAGLRSTPNSDRGRFELTNNAGRSNMGGGGKSGGGGNQRSSMQSAGGSSTHGGASGGGGNNSNSSNENTCVVHCFFAEMNMLNSDDFPDRHKVKYMLTKDLRDRELRNFYTDTIQECFHYLESQRRRDKCHFSRELIGCMTEYAKANCEDWQEYNMMFN